MTHLPSTHGRNATSTQTPTSAAPTLRTTIVIPSTIVIASMVGQAQCTVGIMLACASRRRRLQRR